MAHELRNLPHIASMAFNEPLMLEPAYARVFFCALAGQLGITRLTDTVSGITLGAGQIAEPLALFGEDDDMDAITGFRGIRCCIEFSPACESRTSIRNSQSCTRTGKACECHL